MTRTHLPLIPEAIKRRHFVDESYDGRFRAAARLLQARYREKIGQPIGSHAAADGSTRKLGSRLTKKSGAGGCNFISPEIAVLAVMQTVYQEPGATIDEDRLMTNLLSSQPLVFNAFGPLHLDLALASRVLRALCPDLGEVVVRRVLFEHSPGRGAPDLTGDHTAWDVAITYVREDGRTGIVAIEVKYSESGWEPAKDLRPHYAELMPATGLFITPVAPELRAKPVQQLMREHVLVQAAVMRGDYDEGRFIVILPELNRPMQSACRRYAVQLAEPQEGRVPFVTLSLEAFVEAVRAVGQAAHADAIFSRYCDWSVIDEEIAAYVQSNPS